MDDGRISLADAGAKNTYDWVVDREGIPVARADYDAMQGHWSLDTKQQGQWLERSSSAAEIERPQLVGIAPDGRSLLVDKGLGDDEQVVSINLADGTAAGKFSDGGYERYIADPTTHRVIGAESIDDAFEYTFFDQKNQAAWAGIKKAYPGENVRLVSWSADRRKIVVRVDGDLDGAAFALVDLDAGKATWIGDVQDGLKLDDISPVQSITYDATDGLKIKAFLTLPKGRPAKGLPLVVLPHGGPAARDDPGFDWWAQALANEGYAVLQPQFRGSEGFGWKFLSAGFGQWGRKMQTDLSDGVRFLGKSGTIDPQRVCIVGASYGGYAAMAGAALDPGVYRCAVAVAGISDLRRFLAWERERSDSSAQRYWSRFLGSKSLNDPVLSQISPAQHIDQIKIPILFIHGRDDTVVDYAQSASMYDAMRRANKPAKFVPLAEEDHWLSREKTRVQMLRETTEFLKAENPPS